MVGEDCLWEDDERMGVERECRVFSARSTEDRVQARPEAWVDVAFADKNGEGTALLVDEAKRISPICPIVAASSQMVVGVRVAGVSPEGGGSGYEGETMIERIIEIRMDRVEESESEELGGGLSGDAGDGGGRLRCARRIERKIGRAVERLPFLAW